MSTRHGTSRFPCGITPGTLADLRRALARRRRLWAAFASALLILAAAHIFLPLALPGTSVLVASRALESGRVLSAEDVTVVRIRGDAAPKGAVQKLSDLPGGRLRTAVPEGLALTAELFAPDSARLAPGRALVSIPVNDPGLARLISDGTHIQLTCVSDNTATQISIPATARFHQPEGIKQQAASTFGAEPGIMIPVEIETEHIANLTRCAETNNLNVAIIG